MKPTTEASGTEPEMTILYDVAEIRRDVKRYTYASIFLFIGFFTAVWIGWAFLPALALSGVLVVAWLLGASFASAIIPRKLYKQFSDLYTEVVDNE